MSRAPERLSKSRVQSGAQCHLRLWYEIHDRDLATGTSDALQSVFDLGNRVGELARLRDPRGVLIDAEYWDIEGALEQTAAAVANQYFVGAINRIGAEDLTDTDYYGSSYFVDPRGQIVGDTASDTEDEVVVRDLDMSEIEAARRH